MQNPGHYVLNVERQLCIEAVSDWQGALGCSILAVIAFHASTPATSPAMTNAPIFSATNRGASRPCWRRAMFAAVHSSLPLRAMRVCEPPRVYRIVSGSIIRLAFQWRTMLDKSSGRTHPAWPQLTCHGNSRPLASRRRLSPDNARCSFRHGVGVINDVGHDIADDMPPLAWRPRKNLPRCVRVPI